MKLKNIASAMLILATMNVAGQNYFSNPSFEDFFILPRHFTYTEDKNSEIIPGWYFLATPDYFHYLAKYPEVQVPHNFAGSTKAKQGRAYGGMILRADPERYRISEIADSEHYTEHLQNKFNAPLEAGKLYCCQINIRLATNSGLAVDGLGIYFSKEQIIFPKKFDVLKYQPQLENPSGKILNNSNEWITLSGIYHAQGGEQYATIGDFRPLEDTKYVRREPKTRAKMNLFAYYYIDQVSLIEINDSSECICNLLTNNNLQNVDTNQISTITENNVIENSDFGTIKYNEPIVLNNIYFDFDKYNLLPESYEELDKLSEIIINNCTNCLIKIAGHTDSIGNASHNIDLSRNRAKSVTEYLIQKGISPEQITYEGFGATRPATSNKTSNGRKINRRVECTFMPNNQKK